jgi:outer membrane lipoprotein carrier protein
VGGNNTILNSVGTDNANGFSGRIDQNFGSKDSMWFRYSFLNGANVVPRSHILNSISSADNRNAGGGWTHVFSSTFILDARGGWCGRYNNKNVRQPLDPAPTGYEGVEATYGKITDLRAEFSQVANNKSLGQDIKAEGTVYLKKGGKMRWEYKSPSPQQIVSDGTYLWVYTPELNQVNKGDAPKALAGPAGSFLQGLGKVREEFTVRFLNPANKTDGAGRPVLDLTPKKPTPLLTRLVLTLDPKDYVVREAVLYDQLQNTVTMSFNRVVINSGLSDTLFAFTPPKGTAVVPLDIR